MQGSFGVWNTHLGWSDYSEDCLYLNVYAKQVTANIHRLISQVGLNSFYVYLQIMCILVISRKILHRLLTAAVLPTAR